MTKQISELKIKAAISDALDTPLDAILFLSNKANLIFELTHRKIILRLTPVLHRSPEQLLQEILWINDLANMNFPVVKPIKVFYDWVGKIDNLDGYHVTAFHKANGVLLSEDHEHLGFSNQIGRLMAKLHNAGIAKTYVQRERPDLLNEDYMSFEKFIPATQTKVLSKFDSLINQIINIPQGQSNYGLIHADIHPENISIEKNGDIQLFDFDDCVRSWYLQDVAVTLYSLQQYTKYFKWNDSSATRHITNFLTTYKAISKVNLKTEWLLMFIKLRVMQDYVECYRQKNKRYSALHIDFYKNRQSLIEEDVPYIEHKLIDEILR